MCNQYLLTAFYGNNFTCQNRERKVSYLSGVDFQTMGNYWAQWETLLSVLKSQTVVTCLPSKKFYASLTDHFLSKAFYRMVSQVKNIPLQDLEKVSILATVKQWVSQIWKCKQGCLSPYAILTGDDGISVFFREPVFKCCNQFN